MSGSPEKAGVGGLIVSGNHRVRVLTPLLVQAGRHPSDSDNWTTLPKIFSYKNRTSDPAMVEI
jgi:hypothetical protein